MRRTGDTTRKLDRAVQELFENGSVELQDNIFHKIVRRDSMLNKFLKRLKIEHSVSKLHLKIETNWHSSRISFKESIKLPIHENMRRTGDTTRFADHYIQELFSNKVVIVTDHQDDLNCNKRLLGIIVKRLEFEHGFKAGKHFKIVNERNILSIKMLEK